MNAAKKIRRFIEEGHDPQQMQVLKELATALEMGRSFDLSLLYDIDMRYFDVAIDLLRTGASTITSPRAASCWSNC